METKNLYILESKDFTGLQRSTNNPFNIRYSSKNPWRGMLNTPQKGFCTFQTVGAGLRAGFCLLRNYIKGDYNTVAKVISRYAPPSENDTKKYIKYVCDSINKLCPPFKGKDVTPDTPLNVYLLPYLSAAILAYESGLDLSRACQAMRSVESLEFLSTLYYFS